ncbi:MAG: tetratricopeptide repeat protein [Synechococcales bacterium]|nr:tetratricopeptide repeat protein [Synechococcales bacterium]
MNPATRISPQSFIPGHFLKAIALGLLLPAVSWSGGIAPIAPAQATLTSAAQLRQQGLQLRQQGDLTEAIAVLQQAVEQEPSHLNGRVLLGWTLHKAGDRDRAAQELVDVVIRNPFQVEAWNALGIVDLVAGNIHSSVASHSWAVMLKPKNEIAHYNLSLALHRLQDYDRALLHAERATQLEPENPHPWIAKAIAQLGQGKRPEAIVTLQAGLALNAGLQDSSFLKLDLQEAGFSEEQIDLVASLKN